MSREVGRLLTNNRQQFPFSQLHLEKKEMSIRILSATVNMLCSVLCSRISAGEKKESVWSSDKFLLANDVHDQPGVCQGAVKMEPGY